MNRGSYYGFDKIQFQMNKNELEEKKLECQCVNDHLWREILAYMAAAPPVMMKNDDGEEYPYPEFLVTKLQELRDEIESNAVLIARLEDGIETMCEKNDYAFDD